MHRAWPAMRTRAVVAWIALVAMASGLWLAPACAYACAKAQAAPESSSHCPSRTEAGRGGEAPASGHDCRDSSCPHLQAAFQTGPRTEIVLPTPSTLPAALLPPARPPRFTLLRA